MKEKGLTRRNFLKTTALGTAAIPVTATAGSLAQQPVAVDRTALIAAVGDTLIPSEPNDPGYRSLEPFNITAEVMKGLGALPDEDLALFNESAETVFAGKTFLESDESGREDYLRLIIEGVRFNDKRLLTKLQSTYRMMRMRVMAVYYQNYPEHLIPRDENDVPILSPGEPHQITNPNSTRLYTGWDRAAYHGPLTWEEEEKHRNYCKQLDWQE